MPSKKGDYEMNETPTEARLGRKNAMLEIKRKEGHDNLAFNGSTTASHQIEDDTPNRDIEIDKSPPMDGHDNVNKDDLLYSIEDVPPWYTCIALGLQHYLTMFGSTLSIPLVLAPHLCMAGDHLGLSEIVSTIFFVSGLCTLLQTTVGSRLPIVQGGSFAFLSPAIAILKLWECPYNTDVKDNDCNGTVNATLLPVGTDNASLPSVGSDEHRQIWQARLREIQGAIIVASLFEVVIGFSGVMGAILKFIGPLAVTPTVTLIGLSLLNAASVRASKQWWIALLTVCLIALFSQYLRNVNLPCPVNVKKGGFKMSGVPVFKLFPVILAMILAWLFCFILTATNVLSSNPKEWGYEARTDTRSYVIGEAAWFRFPYPGQWGVPTVSSGAVFGILAGVLASMMESVGDYYACARLSGAPPPPNHAVNRGIGMEGIGCILAGAWGSGNGTTSYSQNIGAIGITKVGSRRVIQWGAFIMILLGCLGKFGAIFVTIPDPVFGGLLMVMFGMVTAVGLSNLQFVDLNSSRNLFILGFSIFFGLTLPGWLNANKDAIHTGSNIADQIITVLCSTSMFVGGFVGFVLDNTIPGTREERGLTTWRTLVKEDNSTGGAASAYRCYDLPLVQKYIDRWHWTTYLPFSPTFGRRHSVASHERVA